MEEIKVIRPLTSLDSNSVLSCNHCGEGISKSEAKVIAGAQQNGKQRLYCFHWICWRLVKKPHLWY